MQSSRVGVVAGLLAGYVLLLMTGPAVASSGVSVDIGRIDVREPLRPGEAYTLPTLGVRNPGTERTTYRMVANPVQDPLRAAPQAEWFEFEPATVTLDPGQVQRVRIRLVLPPNAMPGDYIVLVGAQMAPLGSGASVGAAAAARTTFTIGASSDVEALGLWVQRIFMDLLPWSALVPALLVGALALWLLRRRFTFTIGIERR